MQQGADTDSRVGLISPLPEKFLAHLVSGSDIVSLSMQPKEKLQERITKVIQAISRRPAMVQAAKGVVSAGPTSAAGYAARKLRLFIRGSFFPWV